MPPPKLSQSLSSSSTMADPDSPINKNVVIFPFMAQGHIIPSLALAHRIQRRGFSVTLVSTPLNVAKLRSSLPASSSVGIREIPFRSSDHGLPPNSENTDSLPYPLVIHLIRASAALRPDFAAVLRELRPLCVIADIFFGWTTAVCRDLGVFHAVFSGCGGFGLACYTSLWLNLPHRKLIAGGERSGEFSLPDFEEAKSLHLSQLPANIAEADGDDLWSRFQTENIAGWFESDGFLFNTIGDFDRLGLNYFQRKFNLPVWAVGPVLLSSESCASMGKQDKVSSDLYVNWLDSKPARSVLYVSFGSMNTISPKQMIQLAVALETSGKNFMWVVRPPIGSDINSEFKPEWLPEGFEARVSERGLLVRNWAPQVEVLSHHAVSAFLSHCGWNSVLESLSVGVPMLGWPMAAEQFYNVVTLEREVGVCAEVARGKACEIRPDDVAEKIEAVMGESEKGREMRRKAKEIAEMIRDAVREDGFRGSSVQALDRFFEAATTKQALKTVD